MASPNVLDVVRQSDLTLGDVQMYPVHSGSTQTLTLAEQIAQRIADAIISGQYAPGDRLSEQDLAEMFRVSRGPVRDALRILEVEDLVRIMPRRGTVVTKLTTREVEDIFKVRACLMGLAAKLASENKTTDDQAWIASSIPQARDAARKADVDQFLRLAYRFSMLLMESSRNEKLKRLFMSMARQTLPITRATWRKQEYREIWAANWCTVANAILRGDGIAADSAAAKLVLEAGDWAVAVANRL